MGKTIFRRTFKVIILLTLLYLFLLSISLLGASFKIFGKTFSQELIKTTSNPFVALFIGILTTSLIQSSSTTTSMVVGLVAAGSLTIRNAIPIIMGANIGTTVTNTLVAMGHITRKEEFRRAFSQSTIHDIFNLMTVLILFPIELSTRYLERTASFVASKISYIGGMEITSPVKAVINPGVIFIKGFLLDTLSMPTKASGIIMLVLAMVLLFFSLINMVKLGKAAVINRAEIAFDKALVRAGGLGMLIGCVFTAIVQSSSITTSILVPMVAAGIVNVNTTLPIVLGANIGTTITALLASLTGNIAGMTIAFAHLIFNLTGIIIIYPIKAVRRIPLRLSQFVADKGAENKLFAILYVLIIFFIIPGICIFLSKQFFAPG